MGADKGRASDNNQQLLKAYQELAVPPGAGEHMVSEAVKGLSKLYHPKQFADEETKVHVGAVYKRICDAQQLIANARYPSPQELGLAPLAYKPRLGTAPLDEPPLEHGQCMIMPAKSEVVEAARRWQAKAPTLVPAIANAKVEQLPTIPQMRAVTQTEPLEITKAHIAKGNQQQLEAMRAQLLQDFELLQREKEALQQERKQLAAAWRRLPPR